MYHIPLSVSAFFFKAERRALLSRSRSRENLLTMENSTEKEINFNDSSDDTLPRPPKGKDARLEVRRELNMKTGLLKNDNEERKGHKSPGGLSSE